MEASSTGDLTARSVQTIRPHIASCVEHLTPEQWSSVQSGALDVGTKHRLAHMLLNIFRSFSHVWSKKIKEGAPINQVHDALYDSLSCSFTEALLVKSVPGSSINRVTKLMVSEVTYYVKASDTKTRVIPPGKLSAMICSAAKVLKVSARKMKKWCDLQTHCQSRGRRVPSVQDVLMDKATEIIEPILDNVADAVYNLLESASSLGNKSDADDVVEAVAEAASLHDPEDPDADPGPRQHRLDRAKRKICDFFAKRFVEASMCQIISEVKAKFICRSKDGDAESLRSLLTVVESVLLSGDKAQAEAGEVGGGVDNLKDLLSHKAFVITGKLSPLLYRHITGEVCKVSGPWPQHQIYQDIKSRVVCFLSLMSWWLSNRELFGMWSVLKEAPQLREEEKQLREEEKWFQEQEKRFQEEEKRFQEEEKQFQEQEKQLQEEEEQLQAEEKWFQEQEKHLREDHRWFREEKKWFQDEGDGKLRGEDPQTGEEKQLREQEVWLQDEKMELQEEEKHLQDEEKMELQDEEKHLQDEEKMELQEEEKHEEKHLQDEENSAALLRTCAEHVQDAADVTGNSRFFLRSVITKLFLNATLEVKQSSVIVPNLESKVNTLLDGIWAELDGSRVAITLKDVEQLRKVIVKELQRQYCSPLGLLVSMESGCSEGLQTAIASCVKVHLNKRSRSVSRVSHILRKIFRRDM